MRSLAFLSVVIALLFCLCGRASALDGKPVFTDKVKELRKYVK